MEDATSEDTMMDCGEGDDLDEFVDLATDISNSVPNIRDAAERLLTLLGVDDNDDDDPSSSEDEGVEVDIDETNESQDTRFLHQLATSLVQELKYAQKPLIESSTHHTSSEEQMTMEIAHEDSFPLKKISSLFIQDTVLNNYSQIPNFKSDSHSNYVIHQATSCDGFISNKRCRIDQESIDDQGGDGNSVLTATISPSWNAGWEACAAEAVRYLLEVEGFPPHHPKVISLKSHLQMQKDRAFAQYTTNSDNNIIVDDQRVLPTETADKLLKRWKDQFVKKNP